MEIKLEPRDIAIVGVVHSFVKQQFPGHDIVSISYQAKGVPDEGFFPTVTICPNFLGNRPDTFQDLYLNVWIGNGEFVKHEGVIYDMHPTAIGAYGILPNAVPAT